MSIFDQARQKEIEYHEKFYSETELFQAGSWLSRPVKSVLDNFKRLRNKDNLQVLDLGCGVGRNSIPIAQQIQNGKVHCIDLLPSAIKLLNHYAEYYGVSDKLISKVVDVENFPIAKITFDYIIACSCLEHVSSEAAFLAKLREMKEGTKDGGINCVLMSTEVKEIDVLSGEIREGLIEMNLFSETAFLYLKQVYSDWDIITENSVWQEIKEEKDGKEIIFQSN